VVCNRTLLCMICIIPQWTRLTVPCSMDRLSTSVLGTLEQSISPCREASSSSHTRRQVKYHHLPQHSVLSADESQHHTEAGTTQNPSNNLSLAHAVCYSISTPNRSVLVLIPWSRNFIRDIFKKVFSSNFHWRPLGGFLGFI